MTEDLTDRQREYLEALPAESYADWAEKAGAGSKSRAAEASEYLNQHDGIEIEKVNGKYRNTGEFGPNTETEPTVDLKDVDVESDPDPSDLTNREEYIVGELQTGATVANLAEELNERESVVPTPPGH
jgi:DNA-binding NarL/FixJ family response regulator